MHQKVSDAYPELTHYTSASGLKGILESQCLWASHARFLNDTKEIDYFFKARCTALITEAITEDLRGGKLQYEGQPAGPRLQAALEALSATHLYEQVKFRKGSTLRSEYVERLPVQDDSALLRPAELQQQ